jgi:hypothetical protein
MAVWMNVAEIVDIEQLISILAAANQWKSRARFAQSYNMAQMPRRSGRRMSSASGWAP